MTQPIGTTVNPLLKGDKEKTTVTPKTSYRQIRLSKESVVNFLPEQPRDRKQVPKVLASLIGDAVCGSLRWPMVIGGQPGVGKTSAMMALLDRCEPSCKYWTMDEFADLMRQALMGKMESRSGYNVSETDFKVDIIDSQVVVIDDLNDRDRASDHRYRSLKWLLDSRKGFPLIIISNMKMVEVVDRYDAYIASRLRGGNVTWLEGKDMRKDSEPGEVY